MHPVSRIRSGRILAALAATVVGVAVAAPPVYRVTDLGVPDGHDGEQVIDINDRAEVLGLLFEPGNWRGIPFVWSAEDGMQIGRAGRRHVGRDFNALGNAGQVVGSYSCGRCGGSHAFWWKRGTTLRELPGLYDGAPAWATAINRHGTVAGGSYVAEGGWHVVTWDAGQGVVDRTPGLDDPEATGINDRGQITGGLRPEAYEHAMLVDPDGHVTDLGTFPGGNYSFGRAINGAGTIVGFSEYQDSGFDRKAFVWTSATGLRDMAEGSAFEGLDADAFDIDDDGEAVGWVGGRAFWWSEADGMHAMDDLVDPADPLAGRMALDGYSRINESGVVAAAGTMGGMVHVFVLTPKP